MRHIITTVHKYENGVEYLGYIGANAIGTHVRFFIRGKGQRKFMCIDDRDVPTRYTSLMAEFMNSGYTIID